jgi:hypothetical protein
LAGALLITTIHHPTLSYLRAKNWEVSFCAEKTKEWSEQTESECSRGEKPERAKTVSCEKETEVGRRRAVAERGDF